MYDKLLELEEDGKIDYDLSYRGGHYGMRSEQVAGLLGMEDYVNYLPRKVGAYCNYLGGGVRGAIATSGYDDQLPAKYAEKVDTFTRACAQRYEEIEAEAGLLDDLDADGEENWDNLATAAARGEGIIRGY